MTDHTNADTLRTPIVAVLGHVDHGKTSLLDIDPRLRRQRGAKPARSRTTSGRLTSRSTPSPRWRANSSIRPTSTCRGFSLSTRPATTLSRRCAPRRALADIAVLVVDVNDGFQPQTEEAIDILRRTGTPSSSPPTRWTRRRDGTRKTASRYSGAWRRSRSAPSRCSTRTSTDHRPALGRRLLRRLVLARAGLPEEHRRRPLSAITGEGVPDLLTVLMGLSQRFMKEEMAIDVQGPGEGTVLEVKDERGFGATIDTVVYDGVVRNGDQIVVGGQDEPIVTGSGRCCSRVPSKRSARRRSSRRWRRSAPLPGKDRCARPRSGDGGRAGSGRPRPPGRGGRRGGESRARGDRGGNRRERRRRQGGHAPDP